MSLIPYLVWVVFFFFFSESLLEECNKLLLVLHLHIIYTFYIIHFISNYHGHLTCGDPISSHLWLHNLHSFPSPHSFVNVSQTVCGLWTFLSTDSAPKHHNTTLESCFIAVGDFWWVYILHFGSLDFLGAATVSFKFGDISLFFLSFHNKDHLITHSFCLFIILIFISSVCVDNISWSYPFPIFSPINVPFKKK